MRGSAGRVRTPPSPSSSRAASLSVLYTRLSCNISFEDSKGCGDGGQSGEGSPAPGHRCCVLDLSSFFFPADRWGGETTGRRPSGEQPTLSLYSLCGLCRHYLTQTLHFLSTPHSSLQRTALVGLHAVTLKGPHWMECLHHLCVFFSAWSTFPLVQTLPPLRAPSLTSSGTVSPRHPHTPHCPPPPRTACTLYTLLAQR